MISGLFDHGAMPVLERVVQFTQERHRVLTDNIANLSTPYFKPRDLDPGSFQGALREAIDQRRQSTTPMSGFLDLSDTDQVGFRPHLVGVRRLEEVEREQVVRTLEQFNGNRQQTAQSLGIGVRTLGLKLKKWKEQNLVAPPAPAPASHHDRIAQRSYPHRLPPTPGTDARHQTLGCKQS